jgi:hypothetical protein
MSAHERLERGIAITEGRAWLDARPDAVTAADWVAGAWYYPGALMEGADDGDILVAIREPDNPHDENAIALWSAAAQVGHMPAVTAAILAPMVDGGHALWARIFRQATVSDPGAVLVEYFGPALAERANADRPRQGRLSAAQCAVAKGHP